MKPLLKFAGLALLLLAVFGVYWMLPASTSKAPGGHGHGHGEHGAQSAVMNDAKVSAAGIELDKAGASVLRETLRVNGMLQPNQETTVQVTPRFPGIVRELHKRVGDKVEKGGLLAKVESNQSLTTYELRSPLGGTVIERSVTLGEYVSEQKPAFIVADLETVWADFAINRRDLRRVKVEDTVIIDPEDGGEKVEAKINYLSPVGVSDTQSGLARAVVPNADGRLRPGLFATGSVVLGEKPVTLAVKLSALQTMDNRTVVFVRSGEKFEPREVELGQRDAERVEVLFGLEEGDVYAAHNSFVIKAEIGKASAAHEH
jgi:cobalt-zinc-cadmium efflux system membrane fusion protein